MNEMMDPKFLKQYEYKYSKFTLKAFLRRLYNSVKNRFLSEPTIFLNKNPRYKDWEIGDYTYGSPDGSPYIVEGGGNNKVRIGKFCSIGHNVTFFLGSYHRTDWVSSYPFSVFFQQASHITGNPYSKGDIVVGNDVWIGKFAAIMSGVKVGNGTVIAANSVVTKDVAPYTIVAGNPAKVIRKRFDEEIIVKLEEIAWWNWDIRKILDNVDLILNNNIEAFVNLDAARGSRKDAFGTI
jgi:virginiamycin A acetyltransferase